MLLIAGCDDAGGGDRPPTGTMPTDASASAGPASSKAAPASEPPSSAATPSRTRPAAAVTLRTVDLAPGVNDEASGIALSTTAPGLFFLVDDGTGTSDLVVVDERGARVTRVELTGMSAANAEAQIGRAHV